MAAAVPSEDELVQIALGMLPAQPVVHAHGPALQVGEDPVDPPQDLVGRTAADHPALARAVGQPGVSAPPVGDDPGARLDRPGDEAAERSPRRSPRPSPAGCGVDCRPPTAPRPRRRGSGPTCCGPGRPRPSPRRPPRRRRRGRASTPRPPPRSPAAGYGPGPPWPAAASGAAARLTFVASDAQLRLELERGDAVGVRRHEVGRKEPRPQRKVGAVHNRSGRHRRLPPAVRALPAAALPFQLPAPRPAAGGAREALAPAQLRKVPGAGAVVREKLLELLAGHGAVVFPSAWHGRNIRRTKRRVNPLRHKILTRLGQRDKPLGEWDDRGDGGEAVDEF